MLSKESAIQTVCFRIRKKYGLKTNDEVKAKVVEEADAKSWQELMQNKEFNWFNFLSLYETKQELDNRVWFSNKGLDRASLWPTPVMLRKSIVDAHSGIRYLLEENNLHFYRRQAQGKANKVILSGWFVGTDMKKTKVSLYRPETKKGDPRLWFYHMQKFCKAGDELAIAIRNGQIFLFNFTEYDYEQLISDEHGSLHDIVELAFLIGDNLSEIAQELLEKFKALKGEDLIAPNNRNEQAKEKQRDTDVGMAIERAIGIPPNSSITPDYKGIELKSWRKNKVNRHALFTQVPDWEISKVKSIKAFVEKVGYPVRDPKKIRALGNTAKELRCTVTALKPNAQFLQLKVKDSADEVTEFLTSPSNEDLLTWPGDLLRKRLKEKHAETFWISCSSKRDEQGFEVFYVEKIIYTRAPLAALFLSLIEQGTVTLDHMIGYKENKPNKWQLTEKGPSFKIQEESLDLLFPAPITLEL